MSNGELGRQIAGLRELMSAGLTNVSERLDELADQVRIQNGRVTTVERTVDVNKQRILNMEREIFEPLKRPVTRGDALVFVAGGGLILAAIKWLPALIQAGHQVTR
ncbi:MAG: hypothetical protein AB7R67_20350 [Vicinamibacterales bacterium]